MERLQSQKDYLAVMEKKKKVEIQAINEVITSHNNEKVDVLQRALKRGDKLELIRQTTSELDSNQ